MFAALPARDSVQVRRLQIELAAKPSDTARLRIYRDLSAAHKNDDANQSLVYAMQGIAFGDSLLRTWAGQPTLCKEVSRLRGGCSMNLSALYQRWGEFAKARQVAYQAVKVGKLHGDSLTMATMYDLLATYNVNLHELDEAYENASKARKIAEIIRDTAVMSYSISSQAAVFYFREQAD
ncbi:MAG: hypothetical protein AAF570_11990 [Bacteroidota bacterium]